MNLATSAAPAEASQYAQLIWQAGVAAVDSARLVSDAVRQTATHLIVCGEQFDLDSLNRIVVVGAGKAGSGMARGLEDALSDELLNSRVNGWINVPADCVVPTRRIHLHAARPAGLNEPTEEGVIGSRRIIEMVSAIQDRDLCIVLISGGGSALLPLPVAAISLADKQNVTRFLSRSGATIHELNTVRKRLSAIKGGGLVRAARAGRMIALIISDVVGDPLDIIASGPTVFDNKTADDALAVLHRFTAPAGGSVRSDVSVSLSPQPSPLNPSPVPLSVWNELHRQVREGNHQSEPVVLCRNVIIGSNDTALLAAIRQAEELGFEVHSLGSGRQGFAKDIGHELAERCLTRRHQFQGRPLCWIGGGEPVVQLASTSRARIGGRNQELALAALCHLWNEDLRGISILSGGTDGEDGPTDAAGAICDEAIRDTARHKGLDPFDALSINDSYTFFSHADGLIKTGPTHTNVMDLQVAVVLPVGR